MPFNIIFHQCFKLNLPEAREKQILEIIFFDIGVEEIIKKQPFVCLQKPFLHIVKKNFVKHSRIKTCLGRKIFNFVYCSHKNKIKYLLLKWNTGKEWSKGFYHPLYKDIKANITSELLPLASNWLRSDQNKRVANRSFLRIHVTEVNYRSVWILIPFQPWRYASFLKLAKK